MPWQEFDECFEINSKWTILLDLITKTIDNMCPLKNFSIKQTKELWITPQLIELIKDNDLVLKKVIKDNNPNLWKDAKSLRNYCTSRLRQARADYIKSNLEHNAGNKKEIWKIIQNVIPNSKNIKNQDFVLVDQDSKETVYSENTATYINDSFLQIYWTKSC